MAGRNKVIVSRVTSAGHALNVGTSIENLNNVGADLTLADGLI